MSESASDIERKDAIMQTITYKLLLHTGLFCTDPMPTDKVQQVMAEMSDYPRAVEIIFGLYKS